MVEFTGLEDGGALRCDFGQSTLKLNVDETSLASQLGRRLAVGLVGSREAAEKVLGVDDRARVEETELVPWRMICSLTVHSSTDSYVGTGVLISPQAVLTAAHNLYALQDLGGWARAVDVSPGRDGPDTPFRTQRAVRFSVLHRWLEAEDREADLGVIHLADPFDPHPGHFGVAALRRDTLLERAINIAGYPHELERRQPNGRLIRPLGRFLYHHRDAVQDVSETRIFYGVDTSGGNSGSPAWIQETKDSPPVLVGIHAYGYSFGESGAGRFFNSAARITPQRLSVIKSWIERSVTVGDG
ncbi:MAG: trypsin-like serine protease [Pseudomonadota bacterium]